MTDIKVASRYAKSLIDLALEKGVLKDIYQDILMFDNVSHKNRDFVLMLRNPIINHAKKNAVLHAIFKGKVNSMTMSFFDIVTRKNREAYLPDIAEVFIDMYRKHEGIAKAVITTAIPMNEELKKVFKEQITQKVGKKIELTAKVDPAIIGGFVLTIGDRQMDNSVRYKLQSLEYDLSDNSYVRAI